jgi:S-adenosylmethionine/arginine decarboxylase-like enzyme
LGVVSFLFALQFFESVSEVFEHTVQVKFEDVPKICDQAFVLASNNIDFLRRNLTGHPVEDNLYIDPFDPSEDPFELVHDYRRNRDSDYKKLCKKSDQATKEVFAQEGSPGIFMAVEAEEVTMDLHSMKDVQDAVTEALEKEGFKVDSVVERTNASELLRSTSAETVLVLREGYVAIRTWPEQKYCAFDIHLWSSFEQHDAAKKAVVASVGGVVEKASSYRIVAGGMFGVSTWKDDAKVHGPQLDRFCDRSEAPGRDAPVNPRTVEVALEAGLRLVRVEEPITAAVICGKSEDCPTVDLLLGNDKVDQVIVVSKCPGLTPADERLENGLERIIACEKATLQTLQGSLKDGKLVQAVVVDGGASQLMGQIVLKILTGSKSSREVTILAPEMIAIATIVDEETESWRRNFLDEIRRDVVKLDPVFRAEILFNTTDSSMELGITSSDNEHFIQHLADAVASVNKESGLSVEVRRLHGGLWRAKEKTLMDDSEADEVFSLESYDRTAPMEQWKSQQPMAHQTLFQFETRPLRLGDKVEVAFTEGDQMYEGVVDWVNDDNTYYVKFIHSDFSDSVARSEIRKRYGSPNDEVLTAAQVKDSLKHALSFVQSNKQIEVHELTSAGDGSILIAFWPGGSILVMWDGRNHIDVNLFDFFESSSLPENLALHFKQHIHGLETILRDEQPRGFGRVVNFKRDLDSINPLWA